MQLTDTMEDGFWSEVYRGRPIAILNHCGRWLVYLDHVLQPRMQFDTAQNALTWLHRKVDRPKHRGRLH